MHKYYGIVIFLLLVIISGLTCQLVWKDETVFRTNQTSASMLIRYAETTMFNSAGQGEAMTEEAILSAGRDPAPKKFLLLYDIYIKASSYAILNKVFFWLSVVAGLGVLLWPSLSVMFKAKLDRWEWLKSATVQTTVTAIAALMFTFYSDYKDKQTYAETLMRYVIYSEQDIVPLAAKVSEELSKIDRGFSFSGILTGEENKADNTLPATALEKVEKL